MCQEAKGKFDRTHNLKIKYPLENIFQVATTAYSRQSGTVLMVIVSSSDLWWHSFQTHLPNNERKPNFPTLIINGCETEVTSIDSHRVKRTISLSLLCAILAIIIIIVGFCSTVEKCNMLTNSVLFNVKK